MTRAGFGLFPVSTAVVLVTAFLLFDRTDGADQPPCLLAAQHAGLTFPVERIDPDWSCRLWQIIDDYTTVGRVGPVRTHLSEAMYADLLNHPAMIAALVNRLGIGPYRAETRSPDAFWVNDGDGTEGVVHLLYQDRRARIYYLEGFHDSSVFPRVHAKAVVLLAVEAVKEPQTISSVDTILVTYTRLENRFLAGLVSAIRPLVGNVVTRKLLRGFDATNRLAQVMVEHPDWVMREAMAPPPLGTEEVAFLKQAIAGLPHVSLSQRTGAAVP
jgi:hypothetical protein